MTAFVEVARDVYVLRYPVFDVNTTLVVGDGEALLVDTLSTAEQAGQLAEAARRITSYPWTLVNTHHHFDHCLGNATLAIPQPPLTQPDRPAGPPPSPPDRPTAAPLSRPDQLASPPPSPPDRPTAAPLSRPDQLASPPLTQPDRLAGAPSRQPDQLASSPIWAHVETAVLLREQAGRLRRQWYEECAGIAPELAEVVAGTPILAPTHTVRNRSALDVGGRPVLLHHLGRGHTAGDLVVQVPDADVLVTGDLIEEGGPPMFGDAYPLEWPETVAALLRLACTTTVLVPGHGAVVDRAFAAGQHADLVRLEWLIRDGHADSAPAEAVAARAPFDPPTALTAIRRGYAQLG